MKKRLALLMLAIMASLSVSSVALADYTSYYTSMNNYDYSPGLRKINDTLAVDNNTYCINTNSGASSSYSTSVWKNKSSALTNSYTMYSGNRREFKLPKRDDGYIYLRLVNTKSFKVTVSGGFWLYP